MQSQLVSYLQTPWPLDPSRHPTAPACSLLERLSMPRKIRFKFTRWQMTGKVLHIHDKRRTVFRLQTRRWRNMAEILDPFDHNRRPQVHRVQGIKPAIRCDQRHFIGRQDRHLSRVGNLGAAFGILRQNPTTRRPCQTRVPLTRDTGKGQVQRIKLNCPNAVFFRRNSAQPSDGCVEFGWCKSRHFGTVSF